MPIHILDLPQEIIICILAWTPARDLLKWCQVCRLLKRLIDDTAELQYIVELYSFGYVPPNNPRSDILYTEKLETLREHHKRWTSTSWTQVDNYPLKKRNSSSVSTYDFYGGIYAQGSSLPGVGEHTRRLDFYQLPSVNKGTPWKQWSFEDLGVDTRDFVMQPDYDLLVLLETSKSLPYSDSDGGEDAPDRMQHYMIHLRTLRSNQPHPDAARPIISYNSPSYRRTRPSFYFQIVGRYLAIQFLITDASGSDRFKLRVWDWTTGKDVTYIEPWRTGAESFTFLSDRLILIPCLQVASSPDEGGPHGPRTHGKLVVFTFDEPTGDNPAEEARPIASFDLPVTDSPFFDLQGLSCRCDPAPAPSFRSATRHDGHPRIFDLAPDNRVLCLKMRSPAVIPVDEVESTLYVQFTSLIGAVAHLLDEPTDEPVNIPWKDWVNGTSWVDTDLLFTGNECYVYGQRVVSVGLDRTDVDSDIEETDTLIRRLSSLCVFDFDPIRNKREAMLTESGIGKFDPKNDILLGYRGEGPSLRSAFIEGERAAATPFLLRKTLINERLGHHYYVMVDEEHIVMALQRFGRESALIVYSFS